MKQSERAMVSLAIFAVSFFFITLTCLILIFSGAISFSVSGFAVDGADRLYIGTQKEIQILEDGKLINSISVPTSRTYVFTIQNGNELILSTSTEVYIMDLDGNILETREDLGADTYNQISYRKRRFVSENGDLYTLSGILGRTKIVRNKQDIVYQIDGFSFFIKILFVICFVSIAAFPILARLKYNKTGDGVVSRINSNS